jgi:hypothetical protein
MIRAKKLSLVHVKRTLQPLYAHHQATPYAAFLDAAVSEATVIYPGMVASKTTGEAMTVCNATLIPFGLFANFINGDLDEIGDASEIGVWLGGPDAVFEVTDDALAAVSWTSLNATAGGVLLFSDANGKLTNAETGSQYPVARLIEAPSNTKIVVQLLNSTITTA